MKEKTLKKKLFTIFLISIMVIGMLLPYMAGEKTYAATSRNIKQNGLIGTASYKTQGKIYKDPEGFTWREQYGGITTFSDSAGERNLFCVNPLLFAPDSTRSLHDMLSFYPKMTQTKLNYIASGVDYLLNRYPQGNTGEKQVLAQMFIWKEMSGIGEYEISSLTLTGTGSTIYNDGMAKARSWASSHQNKAVGRGLIYASSDKMQQTVAKFYVSYQGKLNLKKVVGSHSDLVSKFPDRYSLKGAVYTVYRDSGLTSSVGTLTTDANGNTNTLEVQQGTYYVKETKAPKGFKLDPKVYTVNVTSGKTSTLNTKDEPEVAYAKLKKDTLSDKKLTDLCPEQYTLEGAKYGVYSDSGLSKQVGTLVTYKDGNTGSLTIAPGTYYVKELTSPKGYALDKKTYTVNAAPGKTSLLKVSDKPLFDPLSLKIEKKAAKGSDKNLSLEGAEYTVKYYKEYLNKDQVKSAKPFRTWVFKTDENGVFLYADIWKIGGDDLFKNDKGIPVGLLGTYTIEETKAPKGFAKTEGIISLQQVKVNNTLKADLLWTMQKPYIQKSKELGIGLRDPYLLICSLLFQFLTLII